MRACKGVGALAVRDLAMLGRVEHLERSLLQLVAESELLVEMVSIHSFKICCVAGNGCSKHAAAVVIVAVGWLEVRTDAKS